MATMPARTTSGARTCSRARTGQPCSVAAPIAAVRLLVDRTASGFALGPATRAREACDLRSVRVHSSQPESEPSAGGNDALKTLKETAALDELIDRMLSARSQQQVGKGVACMPPAGHHTASAKMLGELHSKVTTHMRCAACAAGNHCC